MSAFAQWDAEVGAVVSEAKPIVVLPVAAHGDAAKQRPPELMAFFAAKGISDDTVAAFDVYAFPRLFQEFPEAELPAVVFVYLHQRETVNRAYRHPSGRTIEYEGAALPTLFNFDAIDATDPQEVVWTQREMDVLALHEAGYPQAVCLPQATKPGAPVEGARSAAEDRRFAAFQTHEAVLAKARKIYLAFDASEAGIELREEVARRLGRQRCYLVEWPSGARTAGEVLQRHGRDALGLAVAKATAYPIQGVQLVQDDTLLALRRRAPPATMSIGLGIADKVVRIPAEGRVIIVTGIPGLGKSSFVRFVMMHQMEHYERRWGVFSPEMEPWEEFVASCAEVFHGKQFWPDPAAPLMPSMSAEEIQFATRWLKTKLFMLVADSEDTAPTLDWWIDTMRSLVLAHGVTDCLIDPWNEIEHARGNATIAEYISRSLQRLNAFARRHGVNVWIVNHPHSLKPAKPGEPVEPPGIYHMDGGAAWANKGALILTIHQSNDTQLSQVLVRKSKFRRLGRRGGMVELAFDPVTGRYSTPLG